MARTNGTDRTGNDFSKEVKIAVWKKAQLASGVDGAKKRKDICGAWIELDQYGTTVRNGTGWEIDHIKPVAEGGGDELGNLQPLQWQNNRSKGDNYPPGDFCVIPT